MDVIILEDSPSRVKALEDNVLANVDYLLTDSVSEFISFLEKYPDVKLVIMDHDLGHKGPIPRKLNYDKDGKSGTEAAKEMPVVKADILIWSVNSAGATRMAAILSSRGMLAFTFPYYKSLLIKAFIKDTLA